MNIMSNRINALEFDRHHFEDHPPLGTLAMHVTRFATIEIIRFDPRKTKPRDVVVGVTLLGFYIQTTMWLETSCDEKSWILVNTRSAKFFRISRWPYTLK